jgi:NAD(P)-dependent dehydrogenase (short-subunit alcohol dehydrogenase family)
MDLGIAGKIAFVAGGSKGMGRSAALLLAAEGCRVAVVARDQGDIDKTVSEIESAGGTAMGVSTDLGTREGVNAGVAAVADRFGSPDIVVGQTNDFTLGSFNDTTDEDYERVFRVFTLAQIYLARATVPAMQQKKWGRFIHIGSLAGKEPQFSHPHIVHNTVRPSTVAFLRVLANEVAADGVTVNVIGPGLTATPTLEHYIAEKLGLTIEEGREWLRGNTPAGIKGGQGAAGIPMKRAGTPDEIGGLVAFLASNYAGYLTGEWIAVDGGRHNFAF